MNAGNNIDHRLAFPFPKWALKRICLHIAKLNGKWIKFSPNSCSFLQYQELITYYQINRKPNKTLSINAPEKLYKGDVLWFWLFSPQFYSVI